MTDKYPGIKRVALHVAYDENLLDGHKSEENWLRNFFLKLDKEDIPETQLQMISDWYLSLTEFELSYISGNPDELEAWNELAWYSPNPEVCVAVSKLLSSYVE